jgi:outer membrane protein assembly factor BamB
MTIMDSNAAREPVLAASIDIRAAGPRCRLLLGDLDGDGRMELLFVQPDNRQDVRHIPHQTGALTAFDLDGRLLWQTGRPSPDAGGPGSDYPAQIVDCDGDGRLEALCVMDGRLLVLDGRSGRAKASLPLPAPHAHDCIIPADLTGRGLSGEWLLKDRYRNVWAMDGSGRVLWRHVGNPGHYPWVYDFDGDGRDEVMAGYTLLDHDGRPLWTCEGLTEHADCIWVGDVNGDGEPENAIGGSAVVLYDRHGRELWRYTDVIEPQHLAIGRFRPGLPGLQIAGVDRIVREDDGRGRVGKDAVFLLDGSGRLLWKEERRTPGWLTILEPLSGWTADAPDYMLAYRRGGGVKPALYDGHGRAVCAFPLDGYAAHADLAGTGLTQVVLHDDETAAVFASGEARLRARPGAGPLPQPKRLSHATLYPGGEV